MRDVLGLGFSSDVPRPLSPLDAALYQDLCSSPSPSWECFHLEQVYPFFVVIPSLSDRSLLCAFHCSLNPCSLHPMTCVCSIPSWTGEPGDTQLTSRNLLSLQAGAGARRGHSMVLLTDPLFLLRTRLWIQFWCPRVPHGRESV